MEIVGVVDDIRDGPLNTDIWPAYLLSDGAGADRVLLGGRTGQRR